MNVVSASLLQLLSKSRVDQGGVGKGREGLGV